MKRLNSTMFTCAQVVNHLRHDSAHRAPSILAVSMFADKRDN